MKKTVITTIFGYMIFLSTPVSAVENTNVDRVNTSLLYTLQNICEINQITYSEDEKSSMLDELSKNPKQNLEDVEFAVKAINSIPLMISELRSSIERKLNVESSIQSSENDLQNEIDKLNQITGQTRELLSHLIGQINLRYQEKVIHLFIKLYEQETSFIELDILKKVEEIINDCKKLPTKPLTDQCLTDSEKDIQTLLETVYKTKKILNKCINSY